MMFAKVSDTNGGRWVLKRKFGLAFLCILIAAILAWQAKSNLGEWTAFCTVVLGLIFAADITDKKLNGPQGLYHTHDDS